MIKGRSQLCKEYKRNNVKCSLSHSIVCSEKAVTQGNYNLDSHLRGARVRKATVGWASPGHLLWSGSFVFLLLLSFNARNRKPCQDKLHLKTNKQKPECTGSSHWNLGAEQTLFRSQWMRVFSVVLLPSLHILDAGFNFRYSTMLS